MMSIELTPPGPAANERLASLVTLTAGLAHELRNPLNSAHLQLAVVLRRLGRDTPDVSGAVEAVQAADGEIRRLTRLVHEFLSFARPQPTRCSTVDLCELALEVAHALAAEASAEDVAIVVKGDGALEAQVDGERVRELLRSLVRNGIEAAPAGGSVVVCCCQVASRATVAVSDDGPGVPHATRIFEPFFTTKPGGTGLGLALVHRIAADHGGAVTVAREAGRTVFRVAFPL